MGHSRRAGIVPVLAAAILAFAVLTSWEVTPASAATKIKLEPFAETLVHPLVMVSPPDGSKRHFIVEQPGTIQILMPDGKLRPTPFIDLSRKMVKLDWEFDERGLLGLVFHPKFKENGKFYVVYSAPVRTDASRRARLTYSATNYVSEFRVSKTDPNKADLSTERIIFFYDKPQFNHNGGNLLFGPDGYLYISTGDGGFANDKAIGHTDRIGNSQDLKVPLGKVLRVDVNSGDPYTVPKDNPFVGNREALPEIWAYGLRNPWRMSFDQGGEHQLYAADVGQNTFEEVDIIVKGGNYGWNRMEGMHCFYPDDPNNHPDGCDRSGITLPIFEYGNMNVIPEEKGAKGLSITGGYIYRGKALPKLDGAYIFGDWSKSFTEPDGRLMVAYPPKAKGGAWAIDDLEVVNMDFHSYVLAFAQDDEGEVYVMASTNTAPGRASDKIYKIVSAN
jgi:glucose/arabinose dehydrogenase